MALRWCVLGLWLAIGCGSDGGSGGNGQVDSGGLPASDVANGPKLDVVTTGDTKTFCTPKASRCDGAVSYTCTNDGASEKAWDCAADKLLCEAGTCKSKPFTCAYARPLELRTGQPVAGSVAVVFAVDDCDGAPIIGLDEDKFEIREDGEKISQTESSATPLAAPAEVFISLVLDNSPSVKEAGALPKAVAAAKAYAEKVLSGASTDVFVGVSFFSKALKEQQAYTSDKAAVLAALDGLLTDTTGSNTTNLYGSLVDVLAKSKAHQDARKQSMAGGIATLGQVVLFTDGSDQAALKTLKDAQDAVAASPDDVILIAFGGDEVKPDVIEQLGRNGHYVVGTAEELETAFADAAKLTLALQKRVYVLGYCSPKLAGKHLLTITVKDAPGKTDPVAIEFIADGFGDGAVGCSEAAFESACTGKSCGGLLCGSCGPGTCQGATGVCTCPQSFAGDHCDGCSSHFTGVGCTECSAQFTGSGCAQCASDKVTGEDCDECKAGAHYAAPDCSECLPQFTGLECSQCANSKLNGSECDGCVDGHFAPPTCESCSTKFSGPACDQCASPMKSGLECTDCKFLTGDDSGTPPIAASDGHTCAVRPDGNIMCWGNTAFVTMQEEEEDLVAVATGQVHVCALTADGSISCWGIVGGGGAQATPPAGIGFTNLVAGAGHTCALKNDGSINCWGSNAYGQILSPPGTGYLALATGPTHSCAIKADTSVTCWGDSGPTPSPTGSDFAALSAGSYFTCALKADGTVTCWGKDNGGVTATPSAKFTTLTAGWFHVCGLALDGSIHCWGSNDKGQATPPTGTKFAGLAAGYNHTCALNTAGSATCWGSNDDGKATPPTCP